MCSFERTHRRTLLSILLKTGVGLSRQLLLSYLDLAVMRQQLNILTELQPSCPSISLSVPRAKKCTFHSATLILAVSPALY